MAHYEGIVTFVTSAQFAAIIGLVILLVKQIKKVKKNTETTNSLQIKIVELDEMQRKMVVLTTQMAAVEQENRELKNTVKLMSKQFNLFFEAQTILYSTHKNENTRSSLMRIANKARTLTGDEPIDISHMEIVDTAKIQKTAEKAKTTVEKTVDTVKKVKKITDTTRY